MAPPAGEFFLNEESPRPVVLLSGGVGLTPMISMLETIAARYPNKAVHYVHGTLNGSTHAMRDRVSPWPRPIPTAARQPSTSSRGRRIGSGTTTIMKA